MFKFDIILNIFDNVKIANKNNRDLIKVNNKCNNFD